MFVFPGQEGESDVENRRVPPVGEGRWVNWETVIGTYIATTRCSPPQAALWMKQGAQLSAP